MCCACTGDGDLQPHDFRAWSQPCHRKAGGDSSSGYGGLGCFTLHCFEDSGHLRGTCWKSYSCILLLLFPWSRADPMAVVMQWVILIPCLQGLLLQMGSWTPAYLQVLLGACLKPPALYLCCQEGFMKKRVQVHTARTSHLSKSEPNKFWVQICWNWWPVQELILMFKSVILIQWRQVINKTVYLFVAHIYSW